jgi:hypothetical protein
VKLDPPPREIDRETARALKLEHGGRARLGIAFMVTAAVFFASFSAFSVRPRRAGLDKTGAAAPGVIEQVAHRETVLWVLKYRFKTPSGKTYRDEMTTNDWNFSLPLRPGDAVEVRYDAGNPRLSKIRGVEIEGFPWWTPVFPAAGFVAAAVWTIFGYRRYFAARRIYREGTQAAGLLALDRMPRLAWRMIGFPVRLRYTFTDENGTERGGYVRIWMEALQKRHMTLLAQVGSECTVLYDRDNPSKSLLYDALALENPG